MWGIWLQFLHYAHAMQRRQYLYVGQQWLLSFLVLVASMMHLTRSPEMGGWGLMNMSPVQSAHKMPAMPGMDMSELEGAPTLTPPSSSGGHSDQHIGVHCPFCYTASFALKVQSFYLIISVALVHYFYVYQWGAPDLALGIYVDARAPPSRSYKSS